MLFDERRTDYARLAGHRFPGDSYTLPEHVGWLWADAIGAKPEVARLARLLRGDWPPA